jgi:hypothetical protein
MIRISRLVRSNRSDRAPIRILLHPNTNPPSNITFANMGGRKKDTQMEPIPSIIPGQTWKLQKRCRLEKETFKKKSGSPNCCLTDSSNP